MKIDWRFSVILSAERLELHLEGLTFYHRVRIQDFIFRWMLSFVSCLRENSPKKKIHFHVGDRSANQTVWGWLSCSSPYKEGHSAVPSWLFPEIYTYQNVNWFSVYQNIQRYEKMQKWVVKLITENKDCMCSLAQPILMFVVNRCRMFDKNFLRESQKKTFISFCGEAISRIFDGDVPCRSVPWTCPFGYRIHEGFFSAHAIHQRICSFLSFNEQPSERH